MEGRLKVVTAIMKANTVPSCAPLERRVELHWDGSENIPVHGRSPRAAVMTPKGFLPSQGRFRSKPGDPVVDDLNQMPTDQNIGEHLQVCI